MTPKELNEIAAKLAGHMQEKIAEKVPPGWYTRQQIQEATGLGRTAVKDRMLAANIPRRKFKLLIDGTFRHIEHYQL